VQHKWIPTTNADYNDFWGPDETQGEWKEWYNQKKKAQREKPAVQIRKTYNELAPHATVIEHKPANFTTEAKELIREYLGDLPRRRQVPDEELESLDKIGLIGTEHDRRETSMGAFGRMKRVVEYLAKENEELAGKVGDLGGTETVLQFTRDWSEHRGVAKLMHVKRAELESLSEKEIVAFIMEMREVREDLLDRVSAMEKEVQRLGDSKIPERGST